MQGPDMATYPVTGDEIQTRLNEITTSLQVFEASPEKFAELFGGSIKVDPLKYVEFLKGERERLLEQLNELPYFRGSIPEQII